MNNSIIKEKFLENANICENERYCELAKKIDGVIKKIVAEKDENAREKLLTELNCLFGEQEIEVFNESFAEGFKTGLKLGAEAFFDGKN